MSDPVTSVEIEDVLSSIRRLVSNDERPKSVTAATDAPSHVASERLVLTPSLRIDTAAPNPANHGPEGAAKVRSGADGPEVAAAATRLPTYIAQQEDARDDGVLRIPEKVSILPGTSAVGGPARPQPSRDAKAELRARVAELEEVVSRQGDQWEPDGASPDANSGSTGAPLPWEECVRGLDDDTQEGTVAEDAVDAALRNLAAKPRSAPNDVVDASDTFGADDSLGVDTPEKGSGRNVLAAGSGVLDEAALHDLVADIVRQELQGALGESITCNIRTLVRREIQRALASQEAQ